MKPNKLISVTCRGNAWLRPDQLVEFQGDLKTLSEQNYQKLRVAIADPKIGFSFPIFVWRNKKKNYIIDGHQRLITVRRMIKEGYTLEPLTVIDLYLGSGTTLIACEKTGRICYGMEIEPLYCDVILQRWADYTGKDPVREDGMKWSKLCRR